MTLLWGDRSAVETACARLALSFEFFEGHAGQAAALWVSEGDVPEPSGWRALNDRIVAWLGDRASAAYLFEQLTHRSPLSEVEDQLLRDLPGPLTGVVWDLASGGVTAFRDRMGTVPLHLRHTPPLSAISTLAPHVGNVGERAPQPNVRQMARFLHAVDDLGPEGFLAGVERMLPGELARVNPGGEVSRCAYWRPRASPDDSLTIDEAATRLRRAMEAAVAPAGGDRLPVVCISGGLDSPSLAAIMARQRGATRTRPLETASMVFPRSPSCDESRELDELEATLPIRIHRLEMDDRWPLRDLSVIQGLHAMGPCQHPGGEYELVFWRWIADRLGPVELYLGTGADQALTVSRRRLLRALLLRGQWSALRQHLKSFPRLAALRSFAGLVVESVGAESFVARARARWRSAGWGAPDLARGSWLRTPDDVEMAVRSPGSRDQRLEIILGQEWEYVSRFHRELVRALGHPARRPFLDHKIWELVLQFAPLLLRTEAQSKGVLRAAMKGLLPERVRLRPKAGSVAAHVERGVGELGAPKVRALFQTSRLADLGLIDVNAFRTRYEEYCRLVISSDRARLKPGANPIWRTIAAELWLRAIT